MNIYLRVILSVFCLATFFDASATEPATSSRLTFEENKGQWPSNVCYKADINSARVFLEKDKFTYVYYDPKDLDRCHSHSEEAHSESINPDSLKINCHAFKVSFLGCSESVILQGRQKKQEYYNYFIGNDRSKWASKVNVFEGAYYTSLYQSIDLQVYSHKGNLKYDFVVQPNADIHNIKLLYEGVKGISLREGNLIIITSINEIIEQKPFAYQEINSQKIEVRCKYILKNNVVTFKIVSPYNKLLPIIIDPEIIAATYLCSPSQMMGGCATYDSQGNIYGGGLSFGIGYPVTNGAFSVSFSGRTDIAICKFNSTGSSLIYSTFLGGENTEWPQSIIVNSNNELCIFGTSASSDFPTSSGCFDSSFNGGFRDIIISHLDSSGSSLIGSTFLGGNNFDGCIDSGAWGGGIRPTGEIIVDSSGNIYVASLSQSVNFPITSGARPPVAGKEAVVLKLNADCSNLLWSTCIGGTGDDIACGLRLLTMGDLVITGNTNSSDFPSSPGSYQPAYLGGTNDGFITRISPFSNSIISSTFYGTTVEDKSFFIDIDSSNNVYILGQTIGNIPITTNTFGVAGGRNFIAKLDPSLSTLIFQTVIGNMFGIGKRLIPTAFCVDLCENIYLSGYYGTSGPFVDFEFPITSNAFYSDPYTLSNWGDGAFYLAQLSTNASSLKFGTFFPGIHVDGGNSRFDKRGIIYQAICMRGLDNGPTLPGSYSTAVPGAFNDLYLLKIDFQSFTVANAIANPADSGCKPFQANFSSGSSNGRNYKWNFGDGTAIDTAQNPFHTFNDTGNFRVQLIVIDSSACIISDTVNLNIYVASELIQQLPVDTILCNTLSLNLKATDTTSGNSYLWNTNATTDFITITSPDTFWVNISNGICDITDSFFVEKIIPPNLGSDTLLCEGQSLSLITHSNGNQFTWSNGDSIASILINQPNTYWVDVGLQDCILRDSINVTFADYPTVNLGKDTIYCPGGIAARILDAGNPVSNVLWSTGDTTHAIVATTFGTYWVRVNNSQCMTLDTISLTIRPSQIIAQPNLYFCSYDEAWLDAFVNNVSYLWSTADTSKKIHVDKPGIYGYQISYNGCVEGDTFEVAGPFADNLIWVPSAFTPNGDGRNDIFTAIGTDITEYKIEIFNRWGQLLFSSNDLNNGWDGKQNDKLVQPGAYAYKMEFTTSCSGYPVFKTGFILLVE